MGFQVMRRVIEQPANLKLSPFVCQHTNAWGTMFVLNVGFEIRQIQGEMVHHENRDVPEHVPGPTSLTNIMCQLTILNIPNCRLVRVRVRERERERGERARERQRERNG